LPLHAQRASARVWCRSIDRLARIAAWLLLSLASAGAPVAAASDIVLHASDISTLSGDWSRTQVAGAAGGQAVSSADQGWSQPTSALSTPIGFVEASFTAEANVTYRVWLRLRAGGDSKYNDSVWVQFSNAVDASGTPLYPIGSTSGLLINLERCSGCGVFGWGWQDGAYWLQQATTIRFAAGGTQRLRIQTREDGAAVDQVVLSASTYRDVAPGAATDDTTIVSKTAAAPAWTAAQAPYTGVRAAIPGTVRAEEYDLGGEGVAFHDTTPGNAGGAFRSDDVDLEPSAGGGYNVGWTAAGEWLNYSVQVSASGAHTAQLRVASPAGAVLYLGFSGPNNVWARIAVPATGGWQNWTTVSVPVTLGAGPQLMTILFETAGTNLHSIVVSAPGGTSPSPPHAPTGAGPYGGVAVTLPGTVEAERFDTGEQGISYHDTTPGNAGGAFRSDDVDLEPASGGGYNIGWTAPGEWLNYTVQVPAAGSYVALIRVAAPSGGRLHLGFNKTSSVWADVALPATGGWQQWTTVQVPVTLGAGLQQLTVLFDTGGVNLDSVTVVAPTTTTTPAPSGTSLPVVTWNIQINDSSEAHARLAMGLLVQMSPRTPEIIIVQEAHLPHVPVYLDELQRQTGRTWRGAFATQCAPGTWNGSGCSPWHEGVGIFTTYEIVDSGSLLMPYADCWTAARVAVRAAVNVNGRVVQVFGTHLQSNSCGDMSAQRRSSMAQFKTWAAQFSAPQIAGGDFNGETSEINTTSGMLPDFIDTWSVGTGGRVTAYGPTPTKKLDYLFVDDGGNAVPETSEVLYSTASASDHYPVYAVIRVR